MITIHPSAHVSADAIIGDGSEIGPYTVVHANVELGHRVKVGSHCELGIATPLGDGTPLKIGNDSLIRSHSVFYESSSIQSGMVTGHHVIVREKTNAGTGFQIGTFCEIQGDCLIGDYVRFQSSIFAGKNTVIGNFVWILPYAVLTNDPTPPSNVMIGCKIEDYASVGAAAVIMPGVTVGHNSLIAANACVTRNVPSWTCVAGVPAIVRGSVRDIKLRDGSGRFAYPWTNHFRRGYPDAITECWENDE